MEYLDVINAIQASQDEAVGVRCPMHFQWSMLECFRRDLPGYLIFPLTGNEKHVGLIIQSHRQYYSIDVPFPYVFLYDVWTQPEKDSGLKEFILY